MTQFDHSTEADNLAAPFPYFTNPDPALSRSSGGRDPLGLLPIWSAFGRKLVPFLASPVGQVNGIRAVVLIMWLTNRPELEQLLGKGDTRRHFFRLMEGMIEYSLYQNGDGVCYGKNMLAGQESDFHLTIKTPKTAVNGLYQYYRGTVRRAGLIDDDGNVPAEISKELSKLWTLKATKELVAALKDPLSDSKATLVPHRHLEDTELASALKRVFNHQTLLPTLQDSLFGCDNQRTLARDFLALRGEASAVKVRFDEMVSKLESPALKHQIDCVLRCEPFLLVLQDVFDCLRGSPGKKVEQVVHQLVPMFRVMRTRAADFLLLATELESRRMKHMQALAHILTDTPNSSDVTRHRACLTTFIGELAEYHRRCMSERGRDPLMRVESNVVVLPVAGDRDPQDARKRLVDGYPWMNDYYLDTASNMYQQTFGAVA